MSTADGYVIPKPGVPKTLGILSVIFGVMLVLLGLFSIAMTLAAPVMFEQIEKVAKEAQAKVEAEDKAEQKAFDDRIASAKTDEEKKAIQQEKANSPHKVKINPVDLSSATDALKDPTIKAVNMGGIVSGLILHVVLLIAGIGLIRLTPWGRSLSLWWAGLQIIQILVLMFANIVYVLPLNQALQQKQIAKIEAQLKTQGAGGQQAEASVAQMTKVMSALAIPMVVAGSCTGMIYPVILLIMLNGARARAACLAKKPMDIDDI